MFPSNNRRMIQVTRPEPTPRHPYFLIIMTNYSDLLQRTHEYQQPNQYWQQQQQEQRRRYYPRGMFMPGVRMHFGTIYTDDHEQLLYNTFRFQLQQIIRTYLHQTHQAYPIYLVFDLSDMNLQL